MPYKGDTLSRDSQIEAYISIGARKDIVGKFALQESTIVAVVRLFQQDSDAAGHGRAARDQGGRYEKVYIYHYLICGSKRLRQPVRHAC